MAKSEFDLIADIHRTLGKTVPAKGVHLSIGDDAAICRPPRGHLVFCSDAVVEGVHFDLNWISPADLAHKSLGSALSDVAAMFARPLYATVSIALGSQHQSEFLKAFYREAQKICRKYEFSIVGGDLTRSSGACFVDVAIVGECARAVQRTGAKPGDLIAVTGDLGAAHAGLQSFLADHNAPVDKDVRFLRRRFSRPVPRFDVVEKLSSTGLVTSCIDISDGLSNELNHLAHASRLDFFIELADIPIHSSTQRLAQKYQNEAREWALHGGEDYQLLLTLNQKNWQRALARNRSLSKLLTVIGQVQRPQPKTSPRVYALLSNGSTQILSGEAWDHFKLS